MVPNEWEKTNFGKHIDLLSGYAFKSADYSENPNDIKLLRGDNIEPNKLRWKNVKRWLRDEYESLEKYHLKEGDFIVAMDRTWVSAGLKVAEVTQEDLPCLLVQRVSRIRALPTLHQSLIKYYFSSYNFEYYVKSVQTETAVPHISSKQIKDFGLLLPPLSEQQKIAKILTTWDKAISTTERLIDNSKQQKKALMQQLLTGKKRLLHDNGKRFEGEWEEFQLSDLALSGKNNFTDGDWVESVHIKDSGCRLIQTGNIGVGYFKNKNKKYISKDSFDELKCTEVHVGDLLICRLAEPAGRACIVPDIGESKMLTSVDVIIMRTDTTKALTKYLSYYFSLNHTLHRVSALCGGSTRSRVSRSVLGKIKLSLPDVQEQQKIAAVLINADKEIELLEQQLADLQQEKKALMQVLLTGKKRVVVDGGTA